MIWYARGMTHLNVADVGMQLATRQLPRSPAQLPPNILTKLRRLLLSSPRLLLDSLRILLPTAIFFEKKAWAVKAAAIGRQGHKAKVAVRLKAVWTSTDSEERGQQVFIIAKVGRISTNCFGKRSWQVFRVVQWEVHQEASQIQQSLYLATFFRVTTLTSLS